MNTRMIGFLLGRILMVEAGLLALPLLTALLYGESLMPWLATMLVLAAMRLGAEPAEAGTHRTLCQGRLCRRGAGVAADVRFWRIALCALRGHSQLYRRFF